MGENENNENDKPKKKRKPRKRRIIGRPRKKIVKEKPPKRPPGRPRKNPFLPEHLEKKYRPGGRPSKPQGENYKRSKSSGRMADKSLKDMKKEIYELASLNWEGEISEEIVECLFQAFLDTILVSLLDGYSILLPGVGALSNFHIGTHTATFVGKYDLEEAIKVKYCMVKFRADKLLKKAFKAKHNISITEKSVRKDLKEKGISGIMKRSNRWPKK